jgi:flagellar biosynthesis component FlhA
MGMALEKAAKGPFFPSKFKIAFPKLKFWESLDIISISEAKIMFLEILDKYIISWIEAGKMKYLFLKHNQPNVIIKNDKNYIIALKYDSENMIAPTIVFKGKNIYGEKLKFIAEEKKIPIFEENDLTKDLFELEINEIIPAKDYEKVAKIFARLHKNSRQATDTQFDDIYKIQRNKNFETLSVMVSDRLSLELSSNLYCLLGENQFQIEVLGVKIEKIAVVNNRNLNNSECEIKINGISINKACLNTIFIPFDVSNCTSEYDYSNMLISQIKIVLKNSLEPHIHEIIGRDDVLQFIVQIKERFPIVIQEVVNHFTIGEIRKILQGLLIEKVSMQNIVTILETLADFGEEKHDFEIIIEAIRISIGRSICYPHIVDNMLKNVLIIDHKTEQLLMNNMILVDGEQYLKSEICSLVVKNIEEYAKRLHEDSNPIIVCFSAKCRGIIKNISLKKYPKLTVLWFKEIPNDIQINILEEMNIEKKPNFA